MAESSCVENPEEGFNSLEKEILATLDKISAAIEEKRKQLMGLIEKFRKEYNSRDKQRLQKMKELNELKIKISDTDSQDNEVMELQENTMHKIEARISHLLLPEEFPQLVFKHDLDEILAKIDTFELTNASGESLNFIDTYLDNDILEDIMKLPVKFHVQDELTHQSLRKMSLRRESIQTRPITDIKIIANKSQIPVGYNALEATADGKAVQLWEGWLTTFGAGAKRFLCYTRQTMDAMTIRDGTTKWTRTDVPDEDQIVVTDLRIASTTTQEFFPRNYEVLEKTVDTNELALNKLYLLVKYEKKLKTDTAVSQLMFLEEAQIGLLPPKFRNVSLPINGYFLCFNSDICDV